MWGALRLVQSIDFILSIEYAQSGPHGRTSSSRTCATSSRWRTSGISAARRERCFVSQPTLSAQLKKLEGYLGVQLIERQPKRVTLTEAGERDRGARPAHPRGERRGACSSRARIAIRWPAQLRIALLPTIGPYLLPQRRAAKCARRCRGSSCMLYEYQTGPMLEKLQRAARSTSAFSRCPCDSTASRRASSTRSRSSSRCPQQHRLAKRTSVRVDDLEDETLLLLEDGHCLRDQALEVCSRVGVHEKQDFRATSLETLRQMVATGAASRCCRSSRAAVPTAPRAASWCVRSRVPCPCGASAPCGARRARAREAIDAFADAHSSDRGLTRADSASRTARRAARWRQHQRTAEHLHWRRCARRAKPTRKTAAATGCRYSAERADAARQMRECVGDQALAEELPENAET